MNDFSAWTTPCAFMTNLTCIIFHHEGLLVGIVTVFANAKFGWLEVTNIKLKQE